MRRGRCSSYDCSCVTLTLVVFAVGIYGSAVTDVWTPPPHVKCEPPVFHLYHGLLPVHCNRRQRWPFQSRLVGWLHWMNERIFILPVTKDNTLLLHWMNDVHWDQGMFLSIYQTRWFLFTYWYHLSYIDWGSDVTIAHLCCWVYVCFKIGTGAALELAHELFDGRRSPRRACACITRLHPSPRRLNQPLRQSSHRCWWKTHRPLRCVRRTLS